jgi:hypothetical protein
MRWRIFGESQMNDRIQQFGNILLPIVVTPG